METYMLKTKYYNDCIQQSYYKYKEKGISTRQSTREEKFNSKSSRACSIIKDIVHCNNFDYFFTLTIKDVKIRQNQDFAIPFIKKSIQNYSKNAKYNGYDFKYIYIFELTKNNGVHLHGFFSGFYDLYKNEHDYISSLYFDNIGFQNFTKANEVNPNYLIKYIRKAPIFQKQLYCRSRGLNKPLIDIKYDYFKHFIDLPFTFENGFCKMITYKV